MFLFDILHLNPIGIFLFGALLVLLFAAVTIRPLVFFSVTGGAILIFLILCLVTDLLRGINGYISQFFPEMISYFRSPDTLSQWAYIGDLQIYIILLVTAICFLFSYLLPSSIMLFLLTTIPVILIGLFTDRTYHLAFLIPSAVAFALHLVLTSHVKVNGKTKSVSLRGGYWQTTALLLPAAGILGAILALSGGLAPASSFVNQNVKDTTDDIFSFLNIPLPDTANRDIFNIGALGYYPLHVRLGGSVIQDDGAVLEVSSPGDILLRATSYNVYEKFYWSCTTTVFSTRYDSDMRRSDTADTFDENRPNADVIPQEYLSPVIADATVKIKTLSRSVSETLFSSDHLLSVDVGSESPYYNQSGELFLKKTLPDGFRYSISCRRFRTESPTFFDDLLTLENYIQTHPESADSQAKIDAIERDNLDVTVPESVKAYAANVTQGADTPLEKILAIRKDLLTNYRYSLTVDTPPDDADFVEYFLQTKTGYCTYFASAMTVLARLSGVPARYVEGFYVNVPSGGGTATVSSKQAHAWCEVYIDGIGWIPIDATAGNGGTGLSLSQEAYGTTPGVTTSSLPSVTPGGYMPENPQGTRPVDFAVPVDSSTGIRAVAGVVAITLIAAAALIVIALFLRRLSRLYRLRPLDKMLGHWALQDIVSYLWFYRRRLLRLMGVNPDPTETSPAYANRVRSLSIRGSLRRAGKYHFALKSGAELYDAWIYGVKRPDEAAVRKEYEATVDLRASVRAIYKGKIFYLLALVAAALRFDKKN